MQIQFLHHANLLQKDVHQILVTEEVLLNAVCKGSKLRKKVSLAFLSEKYGRLSTVNEAVTLCI